MSRENVEPHGREILVGAIVAQPENVINPIQQGPQVYVPNPTNGIIQQQPGVQQNGFWKSNICDCTKDEETCWWGLWCCWLLQARTTDSFELGSTQVQIMYFWGYILGIFLFTILGGLPLGIIFAIGGSIGLACNRAIVRSQIRQKQGIPGTITDDFCVHCCCSCCSICQEAREGKAGALRALDFCSGEPLEDQEQAHEKALGRGNGVNADAAIPEGGNFMTHISALSKTSKIILILSAVVAFVCFLVQIVKGKWQNIFVLLLVFVQPVAILYFVYWRKRRQNATLDFVIKLFAVGFWFTTFQSAVLELIIQGLLALLLAPLFGRDIMPSTGPPDGPPSQNDDGLPSGSAGITGAALDPNYPMTRHLRRGLFQLAGSVLNWSSFIDGVGDHDYSHGYYYRYGSSGSGRYQFMYSPYSGSASLGITSYQQSYGFHSLGGSTHGEANGARPPKQDPAAAAAAAEKQRQVMKKHIVVIIIGLLLMAYVVAAGVEETMKHFVVRCCSFPSPLKDPHAVLVYLMAGALGFATAENIEYVFGTTTSPVPGTSLLIGELLTLLARVLMPIHVICSVLQATNLSKVLMGQVRMSLFQLLLPAILLHGTFDFVLFLLGTIEFIYAENQSLAFELSSLFVALAITVGGAVWAYKSFKKVQTDFENGWQSFPTEDDDVVTVQL